MCILPENESTGNHHLYVSPINLSTEHFYTAMSETYKNIRYKIEKLFLKEKIPTLQLLTLKVKGKWARKQIQRESNLGSTISAVFIFPREC